MDNTDEIIWTISIGTLIACFLLNTSRALQASELCQECLVLLKNAAHKKEVQLAYRVINRVLLQAYLLLNDHKSAIECGKKLLDCLSGLGLRAEEGEVIFQLAKLYQRQSKFKEAKGLYSKALGIFIETGDKNKKAMQGEAKCYGYLGDVCHSLGEYKQAEEHLNNALVIAKEIGDQQGEAAFYGTLGTVFKRLGEYGKAEECLRKALAIIKEIGDKQEEATCYGNLGTVYLSLGEYKKAEEHLNNALVITKEIGDQRGKAGCYGNLGAVSKSRGEYGRAEEYHRKALAIMKEIGDKQGEATCYANLGDVCHFVGEYKKAEEHLNNALVIKKEIGDKHGEAGCYGFLGNLFRTLGKHPEAKEQHEKALAISTAISDIPAEANWYLQLAYDAILEGNVALQHEIVSNLSASIDKCEEMRSFLGHNDQLRYHFLNRAVLPITYSVHCFASVERKKKLFVF